MSSPIVSGILSYGMSGRVFHAPFLSTGPHFKLKAIVERHEKKAAKRYADIVSYDSVEALLADDEIELVVVNTPNYLHYEHTKQALRAGKHVLLEKPATATVDEVRELFALAREVNRHLMIYQNRRWDSGFLSVKEVIESGRLGELIEVQFRLDRYKPQPGVKFFKEEKKFPANGIVYDLGSHLADNAIALFGRPLSYDKVTAIHRENSEVADYMGLRLTFPHQLNVYLSASLLSAEPLAGFVVIGSLGTFIKERTDVQETQLDGGMPPTDPAYGIEPEGSEGKLVTVGIDGAKYIEWIPSKRGGYHDLFAAIYHTIRNNALYPVTEEQVTWQLELLEA
jgi:scyllo-inositol 2-dehydrogenase (NADP+)